MEREFGGYPIQSIIGDEEIYIIQEKIDPITSFTLVVWVRVVQKYKIKDINQLKWLAFNSNFKPKEYDRGFKTWVTKGITAWCTLEEKEELERFQNMKDKYDLVKHDFQRYSQLTDYYKKKIRRDPSMEVWGVTQLLIKSFVGTSFRIISKLYKALTANKNSTNYIKEKWELELSIDITDQQWQEMWKTLQTSTSSQSGREFSLKNLIRFFIPPKIRNQYLKTNNVLERMWQIRNGPCSYLLECIKIARFWGIVHNVLQKILEFNIPMNVRLCTCVT